MKPVVLDACVLLRGPVTDFLLNLADQGLFDPIWSTELHDEWGRNLARIRDLGPDKIAYRREQMDLAFPAAICNPVAADLEAALAGFRTPSEEKDAHVVATALAAGAETIVTYNLRDFSPRWLDPLGLVAIAPDVFAVGLAAMHASNFLAGTKAHHQSMRFPALSKVEYISMLASQKVELKKSADWLLQNSF